MKRQLYLTCFALLSVFAAKASPGDTTWVQANNVQMDYYNNFDSSITLPNTTKTYRKIYMIFTLGKYVCPNSPQYCGDWDYTVQTYFMSKHSADTLELGRFMTPYAHTGYYRFTATWTNRYIFDITDYYPALHDTGTVRIHYSGYSGGFTGNVKFAFIEGTPERNVLKVDRIWHGDFNYGHGSVPINTALGTFSKSVPSGTQSAEMKFNITGHGGDDNACAEFCPNTYTVSLNGSQLVQKNFFRTNCDNNELYAQTGTWVYSRANWCPGALVNTISHTLTGVGSAANYTLGLSFPAYTSTTNNPNTFAASYTLDGAIISYGAINKPVDLSLEDIVSPTNAEYHFRENPNAGTPIITVRNSGAATITSIKFQYGVVGRTPQTYTWSGSIAPLQTMDIKLQELADLRRSAGTYQFDVKTLLVNGAADADATNNELMSTFTAAPVLANGIIVQMVANEEGLDANAAVSQTSWRIEDMNGTVIKRKNDCPVSTTCTDTVILPVGAGYRLIVSDSAYLGFYDITQGTVVGVEQGDGLAGFSNTNGAMRLYRLDNHAAITIPGYYSANFGRGFVMDFYTGFPAAVNTIENAAMVLKAFPNPASNNLTIVIDGVDDASGTIKMVDVMGRNALEMDYSSGIMKADIHAVANGIYELIYSNKANANILLQKRIVIAR